uniref:Dynein regulatory complex protein 12 n=1 Tax=Acanthochromis polyacanthus TaxID=80966 RepID=A0A3Q1H6S5_9TELE
MPPKKKTKKTPKKKTAEKENDLEEKYRHSVLDIAVLQDHILSRQYKTMQTELTSKVERPEKEASQLKEELELSKEKQKREQVEQEKDAIIVGLQHKLDNLETDYEKILIETLDSLTSQLSVARRGWEDKSTALHQNYKELLAEFGLKALDI